MMAVFGAMANCQTAGNGYWKEGVIMMLSNDPSDRSLEIEGLKPQEVKMYDMAWAANSLTPGYAGLIRMWFARISPNITLASIYRVLDRLVCYMYFDTDAYYRLAKSEVLINDHIPGIYTKRRALTNA